MTVRLSALRAGRPLHPLLQEYSWYSFLLEAESNPRETVRLEGFGKWKKKNNDLIGKQTRDVLAYSTVFQPTTLVRAPVI
jgi:hypothetical protein